VRQLYVVPRHRLAFAVWLTVLALPILVIDNIPNTEARAASVKVEAVRESGPTTTTRPTTTTSSTPIAGEAPITAAPPSTTAPKQQARIVAPTTTTAPKTTTTTTTTAPPNSQRGGASWYDYRPGECAHVSIPKGTVVTITSLENGASTSCVVTDRGPYSGGRIIDLDRATFAQLADPARGVVQVEITW
jgi:rare lipoprotein A